MTGYSEGFAPKPNRRGLPRLRRGERRRHRHSCGDGLWDIRRLSRRIGSTKSMGGQARGLWHRRRRFWGAECWYRGFSTTIPRERVNKAN
jgi:hypothetical protein